MWHMFPFQGSSSSSVWIITPTINVKETLILNIYEWSILYHVIRWSGEETARLFMNDIYKLYHGLQSWFIVHFEVLAIIIQDP